MRSVAVFNPDVHAPHLAKDIESYRVQQELRLNLIRLGQERRVEEHAAKMAEAEVEVMKKAKAEAEAKAEAAETVEAEAVKKAKVEGEVANEAKTEAAKKAEVDSVSDDTPIPDAAPGAVTVAPSIVPEPSATVPEVEKKATVGQALESHQSACIEITNPYGVLSNSGKQGCVGRC